MKRQIKLKELLSLINESTIECDNTNKNFKPDAKWLEDRYEELNQKLFDWDLKSCSLGFFTKGDGAEGHTLGYFTMLADDVRYERGSRRLFIDQGYEYDDEDDELDDRIYIEDPEMFVELCEPAIKLNGNYTGTEHAWLGVLVHEMCHYYTYRNGYVPKQAHGTEFRAIAEKVSQRSEGLFSIARLATADEMKEFELSDELKQRQAQRTDSRINGCTAIFVFMENGDIQLTITKTKSVIDTIWNKRTKDPNCKKIVMTDDFGMIKYLFKIGYNEVQRTHRYWRIQNNAHIGELLDVISDYQPAYQKAQQVAEDGTSDDSMPINPGMNLSDESPLEAI